MGKVQGIFVGHRKFAVDSDWKRREEERRYQLRCQKFDAWSEKWITVYRLKNSRLWTDAAIRRWLGVPQQQGKYKVFSVEAVRIAETRPDFQAWLQTRIDKKRTMDKFSEIPSL
ncbi:hypothetical protein SK92_05514 [Klebsiella oxytoca]|uniref:hypothetical protein n=1 Tax=Klebsiella TaxID=570 RepID=UPI000658C651|nr:hypothetical protein [Klebsiella oxytoca]KLY25409.1 hypothetical protein SK92_05514 [Klebsiella oxytoca]MBX4510577.1 hypothetical protein [Klebsiella oxytoca]MDO9686488.1 hypothetical protein [Klebsiella oxytoca]HBC7472063.1 hypothetical protein [Klebsiella oxytoca]HBV8972064.1 hypothetical protein [Klebsiella oxytoca]